VNGAVPPEPGSSECRWWRDVDRRLAAIAEAGRWRHPRTFDAHGPEGRVEEPRPEGRQVVAFASNDYLGLSTHPVVAAAAHDAIDRWGTGSGASRLVTGSRPIHRDLEAAVAEWKGTEAAVCFASGYSANVGVLTTFAGAGVQIFSDELNHASIVDGCRLARAAVTVYRHGDVDHLRALLATRSGGPSMVVTDAVFSMDGDAAPIDQLLDLCRAHGSLLVLDEAHTVLGPDLAPADMEGVPVLRVGTFSKTLGALGGFVAGPARAAALLENAARSYIFTTALSPPDAAAARAALGVLCSPEGDSLRRRLAAHVEAVAPGHRTPIIPVVVGAEADAVAASEALLHWGIWVPAIRPPTVPTGTSRLRVTLTAAHRERDVGALTTALGALGLRAGIRADVRAAARPDVRAGRSPGGPG